MILGLALAAALAAAGFIYLVLERPGTTAIPLVLLRAAALGGIAALVVNPSCRSRSAPPTVLLDRSRSMSDPDGDGRWRAAVDSARRLADGGLVVLFAETPVAFHERAAPDGRSSLLAPALREAVARGGPVAVVTDGELDDAAALPPDLLGDVRVVLLQRPARPDAAIVAIELPEVLRAGDSVEVVVDVGSWRIDARAAGTVEISEDGRVVARERVSLGGQSRARIRFVPRAPGRERVVRWYSARLVGVAADSDPRNDGLSAPAAVTRAGTVVAVSDGPDWDFRTLVTALRSLAATPVRVLVRPSDGPWLEGADLSPVGDGELRAAVREASLLVAHGPDSTVAALAREARGSLLRWSVSGGTRAAGEWYVSADAGSSPVGAALAAAPAESLPPLSGIAPPGRDSAEWSALPVRLARRGEARPLIRGRERGGAREVEVLGTGLWRWAARGGAAAEAYRGLVLGAAEWLLETGAARAADVRMLRDSAVRGHAELVPREPALSPQAGRWRRTPERVPLRSRPLAYVLVLTALAAEWALRRRRGRVCWRDSDGDRRPASGRASGGSR